ncbi:MAG: twin-arginine translocation signal domain-containing protein, partial [Rhodomicrobium sp.]|nr:twin-arginine translocation signal domain-containing protein [Rhodomicrobium sp.]
MKKNMEGSLDLNRRHFLGAAALAASVGAYS